MNSVNKIIGIVFIVLFAVVLAGAVKYCIDAIEYEKWVIALVSCAIAAFSIYRLIYYAKMLSSGDKNNE